MLRRIHITFIRLRVLEMPPTPGTGLNPDSKSWATARNRAVTSPFGNGPIYYDAV